MTDPTPTPDNAPDLRTPDEWSRVKGITVHDPDGWRRDGKPWSEPVTEDEYLDRAHRSTCSMSTGRDGHPWAHTLRAIGPTAPEAMEPGGMVPTEYGAVPGCPNTPPCLHARLAHDVADENDPLPMCCVDGCRCGHDRSQLPGPAPTPDTAAPLPYTDKLKAAVYEATAVLPPKVGEFMSEYFRRCAYWAGQGIEDGDLRDEPLADEILALAARSVAGTPTPTAAVLDQMERLLLAVDGIVMDSPEDRERHKRLTGTFWEYLRKARGSAGTAALTEDPAIWVGPDLVREAGLKHVDAETRRRMVEALDAYDQAPPALPTREQVWDVIATVRDAAPRTPDDADTDDIIDALVDRGFLRLAGDGRE